MSLNDDILDAIRNRRYSLRHIDKSSQATADATSNKKTNDDSAIIARDQLFTNFLRIFTSFSYSFISNRKHLGERNIKVSKCGHIWTIKKIRQKFQNSGYTFSLFTPLNWANISSVFPNLLKFGEHLLLGSYTPVSVPHLHLCYYLSWYCFQYSAASRVVCFLRYKESTPTTKTKQKLHYFEELSIFWRACSNIHSK